MKPVHYALASCVALSAVGCGFSFEPSTLVSDRRILAIQADPPELSQSNFLIPGIGVQALVVDPAAPKAPAAFEWRRCLRLPTASLARLAGESGFEALRALGGTDGNGRCDATQTSTLVAEGTAALDALAVQVPIPTAAVPALGIFATGAALPELQLQLRVASPTGDLYALKSIALTPAMPPGQVPNRNPRLLRLELDGETWSPGEPRVLRQGQCRAPDGATPATATGAPVRTRCLRQIRPIFEESESESYQKVTEGGALEWDREQLSFAWFADAGSFNPGTTWQPEPGPWRFDEGVETQWLEPAGSRTDPVSIWVVVRDGRGGISWEKRTVRFE